VATAIIVKMGKARYAWVTGIPLAWLATACTAAAFEKIFSDNVRIGFLAAANDLSTKLAAGTISPEKAKIAPQLIFNQQLDALLTGIFVVILWIVIIDMLRVSLRFTSGKTVLPLSESGYRKTELQGSLATSAMH
jgi:carbon starvation protein